MDIERTVQPSEKTPEPSAERLPETSTKTPFLRRILHEPSYGYERNGIEYFPPAKDVFREVLACLNIFETKKKWINAINLVAVVHISWMALGYYYYFFSLKTLIIGFLISYMIDYPLAEAIVHRGFNHKAYKPRNRFCLVILKLLSPLDLPEEIFQVAHTVHHRYSDKPGDPYNAKGGKFYNYFTDMTHQNISRTLSREDYDRVRKMLSHCMLYQNSYEQYQRWGTVSNPWYYMFEITVRCYVRFIPITYFLGIQYYYAYLAAVHFNGFLFYRFVNYLIHGGGRARHREGIEFHHGDLSYNHPMCSFMFSQRHNFHHQFPESANNAFLPWSIDQAFVWIKILEKLRIVKDVKDAKQEFLTKHYLPFHQKRHAVH